MLGVAGVPGFPILSLLMAAYGRRTSHMLWILPGVIGWIIIYFASNISMLMVGRFCCGMTSTPIVSLGAIVIGEYTDPKYRGVFLYLKNASVCLGALFLHVISRYLHWRTIALISLVPLLIALAIIYTWPESPAWLASKQHYVKSQEAFYWLRGDSVTSRKEIESILEAQKANLSRLKTHSNYKSKLVDFFRKFTQKDFLKPTFIMILAIAVLELSGRHVFPSYALHIMTNITGETSQSFYYALSIDVIMTTSAVLASFLVKIMNRRTLLFSSGFTAIGVLMMFCLYMILADKDIISNNKPWIPIALLVLYFILANLGCAPIPLALVGEVFPLSHREVGSAMSGIYFSVALWAGLKSAPHLIASIKVYGFFALYGIIMGLCLMILYFIIPETKDRTLQEIENYFKYGTFAENRKDDEEANTKMIN